MPQSALEGIKIADFSWSLAGPITTEYFAAHGATVVRVESNKKPCPMRLSAPYKDRITGVNRSAYWAYYNANKYDMSIDLTHPRGVEVAKRLVAWADVVTESFTPGTLERLGLGYDELKQVKPDIILYRTCNQGQTGPWAKHPGFGFQLVGLAGFSYLTGWPDRWPQQPWAAYTDIITPRLGVVALIAALIHRDRTGQGQCLDLAQYEDGIHFLAPVILDYNVNGREGQRAGNTSPYAAPHAAYRCRGRDRWCVIVVFSDEEWNAFCRVIGNPDWTKEARFATLLARKQNEEELDRLVEEWTVKRTAKEVMTLMQSAGVAAGIVQNGRDIYHDPQLRYRKHFWVMNHAEIGPVSHMGQAFKLSKTPSEPRRAAPCLGADTEFVCKEFLDMPEEEFDQLLIEGVFE